MKCCGVCLLLVLSGVSALEVTPVQKVIQLMNGMIQKGKQEKHEEQVQYAAFKQFCDDTQARIKRSNKAADEQIEILKADIEKYAADAERLAKEIAKLAADIAAWNGDQKAATAVRELDREAYEQEHHDFTVAINEIEGAIQETKKAKETADQMTAFIAVKRVKKLQHIPARYGRAIDAFLSNNDALAEGVEEQQRVAVKFSPEDKMIEGLERLIDEFMEKLMEIEKDEVESKHQFALLMALTKAQIDEAEKDKAPREQAKAKALEDKATAEGDLKETISTREADTKYVTDLKGTCEEKRKAFKERQELRAEEIEAVEKATEIIAEGASGHADKHLPALIQKRSFAQLRAHSHSPAKQRVENYLQAQATALHSRRLSALAAQVAENPFGKVKKMIRDLIARLMEEANSEAAHKGWCDAELATNKKTRTAKTDAVETLKAEIDELEASIAKLTEEIKELSADVAALDAAMAQATKLREEEKVKNAETVEDAKAAQVAVAQALDVLNEFYAKAAEATSFVQKGKPPSSFVQKKGKQPAQPEIFDEPYKGMGSESGGVVGMIEVIQSDFARLEADTQAAEASGQKEYDEFMADSEIDKTKKTTDMEHKGSKKSDQIHTLQITKEDLEGTQKELDKALDYYEKLKPSCVDADISYKERVAQRNEELDSLKEALKILSGDALP